jgi:integral membrane protein (TIGR01906 family)
MNKIISISLLILASISLAIFIILLNFNFLLYNENFINKLIKTHSQENAIEPTEELIEYFQGKKEMPEIFSDEREKKHLKDVKNAINTAKILLFLTFIISLAYFSFTDKKNRKKTALFAFLLISIFILIILFLPFSGFFEVFHKAIFESESWLFPSESNLIQFYPEKFFFDFFKQILINSLLLSCFLFLLTYISKNIS